MKYEPGQVWQYASREGEEDSIMVVVATEKNQAFGNIVNVYLEGLQIQNPHAPSGLTEVISHLPFSEEAIDRSVREFLGMAEGLPPFEDGYQSWRTEFDNGNAGVFTITIAEAVEAMEGAFGA